MVSKSSIVRVAQSDSLLVRVGSGGISGGIGSLIGTSLFETLATQVLVAGVVTILLLMGIGVGYDLVTERSP
jgi:hypothetical protein